MTHLKHCASRSRSVRKRIFGKRKERYVGYDRMKDLLHEWEGPNIYLHVHLPQSALVCATAEPLKLAAEGIISKGSAWVAKMGFGKT